MDAEAVRTPEGLRIAYFSLSREDATGEDIRDMLSRHGVCVVEGVVSAAECQEALAGFYEDMNRLSAGPDPPHLLPPIGPLFKSRGCPLTVNAQRRRLHEGVRSIFASLYERGPHELCQSLDAFAFVYRSWMEGTQRPPPAAPGAPPRFRAHRLCCGALLPLHQVRSALVTSYPLPCARPSATVPCGAGPDRGGARLVAHIRALGARGVSARRPGPGGVHASNAGR